MSVINQMLRDLDARDASAQERAGLPPQLRTLPPAGQTRLQQWHMLVIGIGIGALAAGLIAALLAGGSTAPLNAPSTTPSTAPTSMPAVPTVSPAAVLPAPTLPPPAPIADDGAMKLSTVIRKPETVTAPSAPVSRAAPSKPGPAPAAEAAPKPAQPAATVAKPAATVAKPEPASPPEAAANAQIDKRTKGGQAREMAENEYRKGMQAVKRGDSAAAQLLFQRALELDPQFAKARQALLSVLVGGKQWAEARQVAEAGLALDPGQSGWAVILARLQFEQGDAAAALATLERHAGAAAANADYQGLFAYLLQKQQRPAEAAERFQLALGLRPSEGRWWFGLGLALETLGKADEARAAYVKAREAGNLPADMATLVEQKLRQSVAPPAPPPNS